MAGRRMFSTGRESIAASSTSAQRCRSTLLSRTVIAMEGNGPLHGTHRHLGKIVLADDPVAADFTCARLMGLNPSLVWHLDRASHFLGNGSPEGIELIGEQVPRQVAPFDWMPEFASLQMR